MPPGNGAPEGIDTALPDGSNFGMRLLSKRLFVESNLRVDREAGIIRGVKILGLISENGRKYLPSAIKSAVKLYEGVKVNIDHPAKPGDERSAVDRIGKLTNVRYVEGKGLFGDFVVNSGHPFAEQLFYAAENMPDLYGMSHNAQGDGETVDGVFVVNKIVEVRSVDLVADPATTKALNESVLSGKVLSVQNVKETEPLHIQKMAKIKPKLTKIIDEISASSKNLMSCSRLMDDAKVIATNFGPKSNDAVNEFERTLSATLGSLSKITKIIDLMRRSSSFDESVQNTQRGPAMSDKVTMEADNPDFKAQAAEIIGGDGEVDEKVAALVELVQSMYGKTEADDQDSEDDTLEDDTADKDVDEADDDDAKIEEELDDTDENEDEDERKPMESKESRRFIVKVCRSRGVQVTEGLIGDLVSLSRPAIRRQIGRLALAAKAKKPRTTVVGATLNESKLPAGAELFRWLQS